MMNDKELLGQIHEGFEASGKHLSDDFLNDENLNSCEEKAIVVKHGRKKYFSVTAACAAAAAFISVFAVNRYTSRENQFTAELNEQKPAVQTVITAQTTPAETSDVTQMKTESASETTKNNEKSDTQKAEDGKEKVTEIKVVTEENEIQKAQNITESSTEEYKSEIAVTETQIQSGPENTSETPEDCTVSADQEITPSETQPDSESTEESYEFKGAELILNPSWTADAAYSSETYEGAEYIYTIENSDRYLVKVYFGNTSETFTVKRILNLRIVTIDELVDAGLPYINRNAK